MNHFYKTIHGWMDFEDIYAQAVRRAESGAVFVEVGAWRGRSAAFMAVEIINSHKQIEFHVVDTWQGSKSEPDLHHIVRECGGSMFPEFQKTMQDGGVWEQMIAYPLESTERAKTFADGSIDFLFLDGDHALESVQADLAAWLPKMKPHGVIAGHDYAIDSVRRAVYGVFGSRIQEVGRSWRVLL